MRQKRYSLVLIISIGTFVVVSFVYGYILFTMNVAIEKSRTAQADALTAQIDKSHESDLVQTYEKNAAGWARLSEYYVPADKVVRFIETLEALGPETGAMITLSAIDADNLDVAASGTVGNIKAHIEANGSWSEVMRTLRLAEVLPFKSVISGVSLGSNSSPNQKGGQTWRLAFDIRSGLIK